MTSFDAVIQFFEEFLIDAFRYTKTQMFHYFLCHSMFFVNYIVMNFVQRQLYDFL